MKKKIINELSDYTIAIVWSVSDVNQRAKARGLNVTTEQAIDILDKMKANHDAELGVSWLNIDYWLGELKKL